MDLPNNPPRTPQFFVERRDFRVLVVEKALFGIFKKINVFLGYCEGHDQGHIRRKEAIARLEDDRTTVKASRLQVRYCPKQTKHHLPAPIGLAECCSRLNSFGIVSG
jgi:hypothetical protein